MKFLVPLLVAAVIAAAPATFTFKLSNGRSVEGLMVPAASQPAALLIYFHRSIEDRSAVAVWGGLLAPRGYAVAGYTDTESTNFVEEGRSAAAALRARKEFRDIPVVAMGASLGTRAASEWFASDRSVKALVMIVPGGAEQICKNVAAAAERPILLIQAENDDVVNADDAAAIRKCMPYASMSKILPKTTHRFPPQQVSGMIADWLKSRQVINAHR